MDDLSWKKKLTPEQYRVLREKGTEAPFTGKFLHTKDRGMYTCAGCGAELFSSDAKFDSGTGWPSFDEPAHLENIELREDRSHGPPSPGFGRTSMSRTEVLCKKCGGHLGHVFNDTSTSSGQASSPQVRSGEGVRQDGKPAKKRFCINSCSLEFKKQDVKR